MKALYTINKRHVKDFNRAVDYAEDIRLFDNDDRLEMVLNKYGWNEVEEKEEGVVKGTNAFLTNVRKLDKCLKIWAWWGFEVQKLFYRRFRLVDTKGKQNK